VTRKLSVLAGVFRAPPEKERGFAVLHRNGNGVYGSGI
jgi:hypothetical protein